MYEYLDAMLVGMTTEDFGPSHVDCMKEMYEYLDAMLVGMTTEDFGPSHVDCMKEIGDASVDLVEETSLLLQAATEASEDGDIDEHEQDLLQAAEEKVKAA